MPHPTPERCMDCPRDVTHTLHWHPRDRRWSIMRFGKGTVAPEHTIHRYCHWHATVRAARRNARGVLSGMQELRRLLTKCEH